MVASDRRSVGIQIEDTEIEHRVSNAMDEHFARASVHIDVTSYNQMVLLAGQVPTKRIAAYADRAGRRADQRAPASTTN